MAHIRQQLRQAAVAAITGAAPVGSRVYDSPVDPIAVGNLPCVVITTKSSSADYTAGQMDRAPLQSTVLMVEGFVKVADSWAGDLDDLAVVIESELYSDAAFTALCNAGLTLGDTEIELSGDGDLVAGRVGITFTCFYFAQEGEPETLF